MDESDMYREWPPPPGWRSTVACLWEQRVGTDLDHRVLPDGCADVIVGFGGAVAVGLADRGVVHRLAAGSSCRGLRLRPEAVATFFGVPAHELRNMEIPLIDAVGSRRARNLEDTVRLGAPDHRLTVDPPADVANALRLLPRLSVDETAHALGITSRHLLRRLLDHTGLGPKEHQRVTRLRRFLDDDSHLADAAVSAGYADQSHLTREVARLCGLPPGALRAERHRAGRDQPTSRYALRLYPGQSSAQSG
ncbi:MAG: helix-turn-helix domain-containing protein [Iamia sp.]